MTASPATATDPAAPRPAAPGPGPAPETSRWVCPFCPLLCDSGDVGVSHGDGGPLAVSGIECARLAPALAAFRGDAGAAAARVDGQAVDLEIAIGAAAQRLGASRQPLFGGLGTDVAGARALYALASLTGAISDAHGGDALMQTLRVLQDRGGFTTTLAEVRNRADLIVFFGPPGPNGPDFLRRAGFGEALVAARHVACIGHAVPAALADRARTTHESIDWHGDAHATAALLAGLVAQRALRGAPAELAALAERLRAARYAVIVWDAAGLPAHGALLIEALQRVVGALNRTTRAGAFPLGGSVSAATVNQVYGWLSGLPLRSRAGPLGLEHEPLCFDAKRLLAEGSVDLLLWVSSFGPEFALPDAGPDAALDAALPRIVLGHPAFELPAEQNGLVFIPVSTPGIGSSGHLFRTDGVVLMPLEPLPGYAEPLPTVAEVLQRIRAALPSARAAQAAEASR